MHDYYNQEKKENHSNDISDQINDQVFWLIRSLTITSITITSMTSITVQSLENDLLG